VVAKAKNRCSKASTHGLLFERAEAITTTTLEFLGLRSPSVNL